MRQRVKRAIDNDWRVIYAIIERWQEMVILAIEKRPPYDYEDLNELLTQL